MELDNLNIDEQKALTEARLEAVVKETNAESWNDFIEDLMKSWGEKAASLKWLHANASKKWKTFSNSLAIPIILLSTVTGVLNIGVSNQEENRELWMYGLGSLNILTAVIASMKQFYDAEKKAQLHSDVAKQFGSFYRQMVIELALPRADRKPCGEITSWARMEFDRLHLDAPPLPGDIISKFNKKFIELENKPEVVCDNFEIKIYGRHE